MHRSYLVMVKIGELIQFNKCYKKITIQYIPSYNQIDKKLYI